MCFICTIGQQASIESVRQISRLTEEALTYPLSKGKARQRLKEAAVEFILAIQESYNIDLKDGTTEDAARDALRATIDTLVEEREKELDSLGAIVGLKTDFVERAKRKDEESADILDDEVIH